MNRIFRVDDLEEEEVCPLNYISPFPVHLFKISIFVEFDDEKGFLVFLARGSH